jgi:hypothetical protein
MRTIRQTPSQWEKYFGIIIVDPDGWNRKATDWAAEWGKPMTASEFRERADKSTTSIGDRERYRYFYCGKGPKPTEPQPVLAELTKSRSAVLPNVTKPAHPNQYMVDRWTRSPEYQNLMRQIHTDIYVGVKNGASSQEIQLTLKALADIIANSVKWGS